MVEYPHELAEINVRDSLVTANHQHVFIISALRRAAEIRRAGNHDGLLTQWIHDDKFVMDIEIVVEAGETLAQKEFHVAFFEFCSRRDYRVSNLINQILHL